MNRKNILIFHFRRMLDKLRSDEHQEYVKLVMEEIEARVLAIGNPQLTAQWEIFKNYAIIEDFLSNKPRSAEETPVIANLNAERTTILAYIFFAIENIVKRSPHAEDVVKAKHLDHVLEPYKNALGKNIAGKSADIYNVIQDFKLEPNATYAAALNVMKTIPLLETANSTLESNYKRRAELWLEKENYGTLTQLHPIEEEAMQTVADTLEALYRANELGAKDDALHAQFEAIFNAWNAITEQFVRTLAKRGTTISLSKPSPGYPTTTANPQPPSPTVPPPFE